MFQIYKSMCLSEHAQKSLNKSQSGENWAYEHLHHVSSQKSPNMETTTPRYTTSSEYNFYAYSYPRDTMFNPSKVQDVTEIWDTD